MYLKVFLEDPAFMIAAALCVAAYVGIRLSGRRLTPSARAAALGCLLWLVVPPVLFSFSNFKKFWYVFSSYTALAVLLGVLLQSALVPGRARRFGVVLTALVAGLCVAGTVRNVQTVTTAVNPHHYQVAMMELLDRESYEGTHMYIQYNEKDADGNALTDWTDEDRFIAELYGAGVCLPGGKDAFEADGEYALIFLGNLDQLDERDELAGFYIPLLETRYITAFSN